MNENLVLTKILKDAPRGITLWSPLFGDLEFVGFSNNITYPILCSSKDITGERSDAMFSNKGAYRYGDVSRFDDFIDSECELFPSKENQDWSTFNRFNHHQRFESFQKVLRVDNKRPGVKIWTPDFYAYYDKDLCGHHLVSGLVVSDAEVIPYDGNENKVGKVANQLKKLNSF